MYYVVRLAGIIEREKLQVFPIHWMRNSSIQLQKFVKNRINRNQVQLFYWSNEKNADGEPNMSVQPNFNLPTQNTFPPAIDGCFMGQPLDFFCNYADANAHMNRLRSTKPGLYNARRLAEAPLPDLNQNINEQNSDSDGENSESENPINDNNNVQSNNSTITEEPQPNERADSNTSFDELHVSSSSDGLPNHDSGVTNGGGAPEIQIDEVASSSSSIPSNNNVCEENETKPELHSVQRVDLDEIITILNDIEDDTREVNEANGGESEEEIEMVIINGVFPRPIHCDDLLKREDDPISGNLAYNDAPQVCIQMHISVFTMFFVIVMLIVWNQFFICRKMENVFTKSARS